MSQKMLIVGGSGLVGSTLAQYAMPNYDLHMTINKNKITFTNALISKIDLLEDRLAIINLIKTLNPDIVINTVAHSSVDLCETNHVIADLLHVDITKDIAIACHDMGSKLIHFSTDTVFDGKLDRKYAEEDTPNPINYYGKTRLMAESIVMEASNLNVILRTSVIYGWHERSRFTNWIIQSLRDKKMVDPFVDQYNTPTLVDDLAKSILRIIEMHVTGLYHAVGKTCLSRYEFALRIADQFGFDKNLIKPVTSYEKKQDAPRPTKSCLDAQKLEKKIGYNFCDIDTGIGFVLNKSGFTKM
ncbi:MAG: SDR family oxidoreductase [Nitrosopumilales archaeon]|nr:MAG: SDR family oxidoreductase [Nitrosopumilales archaeon]